MNRPAAPAPGHPPATTGWRADLAERFWRYLPLKFVGISAFMWLFFQGYFHTLRHPVYPVLEMPLTPLDALIPFQPQALVAYLSLWLYVGIAPGLLLTLRELIVYGLWAAALCLLGLAIFYFWPTAVPPRTVDVSGIPGFAMLHGVDAAGNACPSLHVATAMFTALWVRAADAHRARAGRLPLGQRPVVRCHRVVDGGHPAARGARRAGRRGAGRGVCLRLVPLECGGWPPSGRLTGADIMQPCAGGGLQGGTHVCRGPA